MTQPRLLDAHVVRAYYEGLLPELVRALRKRLRTNQPDPSQLRNTKELLKQLATREATPEQLAAFAVSEKLYLPPMAEFGVPRRSAEEMMQRPDRTGAATSAASLRRLRRVLRLYRDRHHPGQALPDDEDLRRIAELMAKYRRAHEPSMAGFLAESGLSEHPGARAAIQSARDANLGDLGVPATESQKQSGLLGPAKRIAPGLFEVELPPPELRDAKGRLVTDYLHTFARIDPLRRNVEFTINAVGESKAQSVVRNIVSQLERDPSRLVEGMRFPGHDVGGMSVSVRLGRNVAVLMQTERSLKAGEWQLIRSRVVAAFASASPGAPPTVNLVEVVAPQAFTRARDQLEWAIRSIEAEAR